MSSGGVFILKSNNGRQDRLLNQNILLNKRLNQQSNVILKDKFQNLKYINGNNKTQSIKNTPLLMRYGFTSIPETYHALQKCPNCDRNYKC